MELTVEERLIRLRKALTKLLEEHKRMKAELKEVKQKNNVLSIRAEQLQQEVEMLKEENKQILIAKNLNHGEGNKALKKQVDEMVREIDKCLELLNK
ncbi:MAG: hypothetical protein Kow00127_05320 [Bacteroidales bacterium]